jgi:nitrite reductase/ring-hydroxylating ferredoxin subunit
VRDVVERLRLDDEHVAVGEALGRDELAGELAVRGLVVSVLEDQLVGKVAHARTVAGEVRWHHRAVSVPDLVSVAVYERTIRASLERIWENVLDWEHLPGLNRGSFDAIRCLDASEHGWRARLRARLPLVVELDGRPFRLLALGDDLIAHSTLWPHGLGPLEDATPEGDTIECLWHRYRFDLRTGRSRDGRALRLMPAPRVLIGPDERVRLSWRGVTEC